MVLTCWVSAHPSPCRIRHSRYMAQARKKRTKATPRSGTKKAGNTSLLASINAHGISMLLAGVVIGSLGTMLWQGWRSGDAEVGSGIRQMMESSRQQASVPDAEPPAPAIESEPRQTNYDFFTVLPEIEVVVTEDEPPPVPEKPKPAESAADGSDTPEVREVTPQPVSAYMLQAGSFNTRADAERQKAGLALLGLGSTIQKVTIQGRGDFFRVRLGPFTSHAGMVEADERLRQEGIKALRLKVSRSGQGA